MGTKTESREITVTGIVIPIKWDSKGNPFKVAVSGIDEQEYLVEGGPQSQNLLPLVKKSVTILGLLSISTRGLKKLYVKEIIKIAE